jgi:uncharacterized protein YbaR (Trm112 family)
VAGRIFRLSGPGGIRISILYVWLFKPVGGAGKSLLKERLETATTMEDWQMIYFKACPKCRGDIYLDRDAYGAYKKCLQCGRIFEVEAQQPSMRKPEAGKLAA